MSKILNNKIYDVVVIGGGHAGLEAAFSASQFPLSIGLVTLPGVPVASAPCNPAIGGVGKGQVVREIDALGGVMPMLADLSGIQFRVLNESKGYAVQSTRVQIDKDLYAKNADDLLSKKDNIDLIRDRLEKTEKHKDLFSLHLSGGVIQCKSLIVTTGTFLAGKLHTGKSVKAGGRVGVVDSPGLSDLFSIVSTIKTRFKTGTPPRIKKESIDFSKMLEQKSDDRVPHFHYANVGKKRFVNQSSCFLTRTSKETLGIIRKNKERSPIFNGQITGVGPRYCPSIEDKAFRYPDRHEHHVFVEPEGLKLDTYYPNGVSTSLPVEIQEEFLRTIPGLEKCEIAVPGYAVEYDVVDTSFLRQTLEHKELAGLYFAGQVNGTSGYEEAAGQGLVAGLNAALKLLDREPLVLNRNESYIGVMVEDLVTNLRDEPYRLFTARSENRLYIREDNSYLRLAKYRRQLGLNLEIDFFYSRFLQEWASLGHFCENFTYSKGKDNQAWFKENNYGPIEANLKLGDLLRRSHLDPVETLGRELKQFKLRYSENVVRTVAIGEKYKGYISRMLTEIEKIKKLGSKRVDWEFLSKSSNISFECKLRIQRIRPENFSQLKNIEGIRPATLAYVAGTF